MSPDHDDGRGSAAGADAGDSSSRWGSESGSGSPSGSGSGSPSGSGSGSPSGSGSESEGIPLDVDAESGPAAFMQALEVPRNGKIGLVAGLLFTLGVFVLFVVIPGSYRSPLWYLALGFVLAISTAGLVAFLLTLARAVRLSREL